MLDRSGGKVIERVLETGAIEIKSLDFNFRRSFHRAIHSRKAQAPFLSFRRPFSLQNIRIDENDFFVFQSRVRREIQDEQSIGEADLIGGKSNPVGGIHQFEHLGHHFAKISVNLLDRLGFPMQSRMRIRKNVHGNSGHD